MVKLKQPFEPTELPEKTSQPAANERETARNTR